MKSYTDLEQSKKLIELGIDVNTADIIYNIFDVSYIRHDTPIDKYHTPAWSLAALIEVMPEILIERVKAQDGYDGYYYFVTYKELIEVPYKKELIDACVEMIIKLHEENLL